MTLPPDGIDVLAGQLATIMSLPFVIQAAKTSKLRIFSFITNDTPNVTRSIAWSIGLVSACGLHWHTLPQGGIVIDWSMITIASVLHAVFAMAGQLGGQEAVYKVIKISESLDALARLSNVFQGVAKE